MSLESNLFTWLKTNVPLVASRVYAVMAPMDVTAPYLVFTRISSSPDYTHDGPSGLSSGRMSFTAVAITYDSARAVLAQLENVLSGFKGSMGTLLVSAVFKELEYDTLDPESNFYQRVADYSFTIRN
jgi:hypothetical protein